MKKLLCILLLLPTVCFAQNDVAPAEWTPALIIFISVLAMISILVTAAIVQPVDCDVERPKQKRDYSYIDSLNENFYNAHKKAAKPTETNRRTIAANMNAQPLVPYEPNKNTEALTK